MILLLILVLTALFLIGFSVLVISAFGATALIIFGDVIVCIFIIVWIIKRIVKKKSKK